MTTQPRILRRTPACGNLRAATNQASYPFSISQATLGLVGSLSIAVQDAQYLFGASTDELIPAPLAFAKSTPSTVIASLPSTDAEARTPTTSTSRRTSDAIPFPAFDEEYAADLLEPAVQMSFRCVDWRPAGQPCSNTVGLGDLVGSTEHPVIQSGRDFYTANARVLNTSTKLVRSTYASAANISRDVSHGTGIRAGRRNAITPLQLSDQNGLTLGHASNSDHQLSVKPSPPAPCAEQNGPPLLLTMHGFAYDLRTRSLRDHGHEPVKTCRLLDIIQNGVRRLFRC